MFAGKSNTPHFAGFSQDSIIKITNHFTTADMENDGPGIVCATRTLHGANFLLRFPAKELFRLFEREETFFAMKEVSPTGLSHS